MCYEEKERIINEIEERVESGKTEKEDLERLVKMCKNQDSYIRGCVAALLVNFEEDGEDTLLKMTTDKASIVRAEAYDSLYFSKSEYTYNYLKKSIKSEKNGLVRGYIITSLTDIALRMSKEEETSLLFKSLLKEKQTEFVQINLFSALYQLGCEKYLRNLMKMLNARIYQNRCATVNSFFEVVHQKNYRMILQALDKRKKIEKSRAVLGAINDCEEYIQNEFVEG